MLALSAAVFAHVPAFGPFEHNCAHAHSNDATLSQVAYFRGTGGLELELKSDTEPVDTLKGQNIDLDVILRDKADLSTFAVYVGCGGCMKDDELSAGMMFGLHYEQPSIEPFTQTVMRSVLPDALRKFDSSVLNSTVCPQRHFVVSLHDFGNRSTGGPLVWSAVLGRREQFTLLELINFPYYTVALHGYYWSGFGWTFPVVILLIAPLTLLLWRSLRAAAGLQTLSSAPMRVITNEPALRVVMRYVDPREVVLDLAVLFFLSSGLERFLHLLVAQYQTPLGGGFLFVIGIILYADAFPILIVTTTWKALQHSRDKEAQARMQQQEPVWNEFYLAVSRPAYAALEILFALFVLIFGFGAGFYAGPILIGVDAIIRTTESSSPPINTSTTITYEPAPKEVVKGESVVVPGIPVLLDLPAGRM
jgi:hypothetical protein